jgi:hypothetical protein
MRVVDATFAPAVDESRRKPAQGRDERRRRSRGVLTTRSARGSPIAPRLARAPLEASLGAVLPVSRARSVRALLLPSSAPCRGEVGSCSVRSRAKEFCCTPRRRRENASLACDALAPRVGRKREPRRTRSRCTPGTTVAIRRTRGSGTGVPAALQRAAREHRSADSTRDSSRGSWAVRHGCSEGDAIRGAELRPDFDRRLFVRDVQRADSCFQDVSS